jgi:UDP-2-acetamido-3-amino-2,3-dideoxy-glucuronate N-acetyltransferase
MNNLNILQVESGTFLKNSRFMTKDYFAHDTAVIDDGCKIGTGTKIWHFSHIMTGSQLGENCNIGQNVVISQGVILGKNVKVQNNVSIYTGVICEDDVFLGPSMVFTNVINPRSAIIRRDKYETTIVERGASIGANATIICGNRIGHYSFIGAGAVVTKDVKPYALVIGNPARQSGWMSEFGHKLYFNLDGIAICPENGDKYKLTNGNVTKIIY